MNESRKCMLLPERDDNYEVREGEYKYVVKFNTNSCSFNWWSLSRIPYKHGEKALSYKRADPKKYVHLYYFVKNYINTYKGVIYPMPSTDLTCKDTLEMIKPPPIKRQPGMTSVAQIRKEDETLSGKRSTTIKCSLCGGTGCNKTIC